MIAKLLDHLITPRVQVERMHARHEFLCNFAELIVHHIITSNHLRVPAFQCAHESACCSNTCMTVNMIASATDHASIQLRGVKKCIGQCDERNTHVAVQQWM